MASTTNADGTTTGGPTADGIDLAGRLTQMSNRTNLMVIDAVLRAAPQPAEEQGFADAAAEVRALARRMLQATQDLQATMGEPAE